MTNAFLSSAYAMRKTQVLKYFWSEYQNVREHRDMWEDNG